MKFEFVGRRKYGGRMMKKKNWIVLLMIFSLIAAMMSGCDKSQEETETVIDPEMTGFEDFMMSVFEGDQYLIVYGSQGSEQDTIRLKNYADYMESVLRFPEDQVSILSNEELTESDLQNKHIILLGNPATNDLFAEVNDQLPIAVIDGKLEIPDAGWTMGEKKATFTYLIPNPLNRNKYLWVIGATNAESFPALRGMTMNLKQDEYLIKAGVRMRYSGRFSKSSESWTIPALTPRKTISDFGSVISDHFLIRYDTVDRLTMEQMDEIVKKREAYYQELTNRLDLEMEDLIEIDIFMTEGIREQYLGRDDDSLFGFSYEVQEKGKEDPFYKEKIAKVVLGAIGVPLDQMVRDGFAVELASSQIYLLSSVHPEAAMREFLEADSFIPLRYLTGARINPELNAAVVREELRSFYHYLIGTYGIDKAIDLYAANANERVEAAIQTVYGKDLDELEDEWISTIKQ